MNQRLGSTPRVTTGLPAHLLPLLSLAGAITASGMIWFVQRPASDFQMFYDSGRAWLAGTSPYTHVNTLSPPPVVATAFAALASLPVEAAKLVWIAAGAISIIASIRAIQSTLQQREVETAWMVVALGVSYASWSVWFQGQILWLLLYPFTRSWVALRAGRPVEAGLWLAIVIVVKPQFALVPLVLQWRVLIVSALSSAVIAGSSILLMGWPVWAEWLAVAARVQWLSWPDNVSAWGVIARLQSGALRGGALGDIPFWLRVAVASCAVATAWMVRNVTNMDRRLTLAILWTVLVTPLGWVHYVPLCLGPAVASWPGTRDAVASLLLLSIPLPLAYPLLESPAAVRSLGNLYTFAVVWACYAWLGSRVKAGRPAR